MVPASLEEIKDLLVDIYFLQGNNRNNRTRCEICDQNFEHISYLVLVFLLLISNM